MKCSNCNKEFEKEYVFCPHCGERLINNVIDIVDEEVKEEVERGPWRGFAKVGYILGNVALPTFWIISLGLVVGIFGIVFFQFYIDSVLQCLLMLRINRCINLIS